MGQGDPLAEAEALLAENRAADAASLLKTRIAAGRGGLLARLLFVRALLAAGDMAGALDAAREAANLNPGVAIAAVTLGEALRRSGALPTAIGEFQRALRLDPHSPGARLHLGEAWLDAGEPEKALEAFAAIDADAPGLAERIEAAEAMRRRPRSDAGYVRHLFDQFSIDYDSRMRGQLSYQAPEVLRGLADFVMPERRELAILDLGCGTGLGGEAFRDLAARIDGVDLSPQMIAKARARGIYDSLLVGDIETALADGGTRYDLILAADTLVYLGDLSRVLAGVAQRLKADGFFLFTVERSDGAGFELGPKRRWRHAESYLREQAKAQGLDVAGVLEAAPRTEAGIAVPGLAVALSRG
jgi:predicted TPR repeat methyltransferase